MLKVKQIQNPEKEHVVLYFNAGPVGSKSGIRVAVFKDKIAKLLDDGSVQVVPINDPETTILLALSSNLVRECVLTVPDDVRRVLRNALGLPHIKLS